MPGSPPFGAAHLTPSQAAELIGCTVDEVVALVYDARLRGAKAGTPARWRIEEASVREYLADQVELTRREALWRQSQNASFPELWGSGPIRHGD
jgi:excisionase family DNA binding protein